LKVCVARMRELIQGVFQIGEIESKMLLMSELVFLVLSTKN